MEPITEQQAALGEVKAVFGPMSYTEDHLGFRLVGFYTNGHQCVQAIGATWEQAIERLKEKAVSPRRIEQRGRWPWRSTMITR